MDEIQVPEILTGAGGFHPGSTGEAPGCFNDYRGQSPSPRASDLVGTGGWPAHQEF